MENDKKQPIIAPFERRFNGPIDVFSEVKTFDDLLRIDVSICYLGMRVWVHDKRSTYLLINSLSTVPDSWLELTAKAQIPEWGLTNTYSIGDIVSVAKSGKLYRSLKDNNTGLNPVRYPRFWKTITGDVEEYKREFKNQSSVVISVPMENPIFQVYQKEIVDGTERIWAIDCLITETTERPTVAASTLTATEDHPSGENEDIEAALDEEDSVAVKKFKFEFFEGESPVNIDGLILAK